MAQLWICGGSRATPEELKGITYDPWCLNNDIQKHDKLTTTLNLTQDRAFKYSKYLKLF